MKKVIDIALEEVGYLEKATPALLDDKTANAGKGNYTKYWRDISPALQGQPWCNGFINWCFNKAYGTTKAKKMLCCPSWNYYTPTTSSYFKNAKRWFKNPQIGDLIYFKNVSRICHIGLVYDVDSNYVYTIEGNTSSGTNIVANGGGVFTKKYRLNNPNIAGYGRPLYDGQSVNQIDKPTLKKGMNDKNLGNTFIQSWQTYLNLLGFKCGEPNGIFDEQMLEQVKDYQKYMGLTVDGIIGPKTWATIPS